MKQKCAKLVQRISQALVFALFKIIVPNISEKKSKNRNPQKTYFEKTALFPSDLGYLSIGLG